MVQQSKERSASVRFLEVPDEPFSENEIEVILDALMGAVDVPQRKSGPAVKTILIDFMGTPNAGKTKTTEKIEQLFRLHGFNAFCPPETAELFEVRSKSTDDPVVFQARHLTGVQHYVLNLAHNRNFHLAIISRGLIDMLYWYERGMRGGLYSQSHVESARNQIYELLRLNIVDAFVFFTCSSEVAMEREYGESVTSRRGSNVNDSVLAEVQEIYRAVLEDVGKHVPSLPIFHVDTSHLGVQETVHEVLRQLLPILCSRFSVSRSNILPQSLSLMQREVTRAGYFEEQLKLRGHPYVHTLRHLGWTYDGAADQEDTYLNPVPGQDDSNDFFQEIVRLRREGQRAQFIYKGQARDRIFSHRAPLMLEVSPEETRRITARYPTILTLRKHRARYELIRDHDGGSQTFTLHLDEIDGLGTFTEIRARGSEDIIHTQELLQLATQLGFTPSDIVEGSYLALALSQR